MIFEVKDKTGRPMMTTHDPRCVYDDDTCKKMRAAGYKVTLDGRAWPPRERKEKKA